MSCEQPVSRRYHRGPGFHYVVSYRQLNSTTARLRVNVSASRQPTGQLVVDNVPVYRQFLVSVQSANDYGIAPPSGSIIGHSGQGSK